MSVQAGDLLLVHSTHLVAKMIHLGQRGYPPTDRKFNHVAVVVAPDEIVEALTKGVVTSPLSKYPAADVRRVPVKPVNASDAASELDMRANAVAFVRSCVGQRYGFATILSIALRTFTKGRFQFGVQGTEICSGLAARSLERLGYCWTPYDAAELTPAYLAEQLAP